MSRRRRVPQRSANRLSRPRRLVYGVVVTAVVAVALLWPRPALSPRELSPGVYWVDRVVDGDTLVLRGGARVRLIGVDTPETRHPRRGVEFYGPEAAAFTRRQVGGRQVRLAFDRERTDGYGRFLAYVYIDETFLNEELIRRGYGRSLLTFPYSSRMKALFKSAEAKARRTRLGIWSRDPPR